MKNQVQESIKHMYAISTHLEKLANDPKTYNTELSYYLESLSWSIFRDAREAEQRLSIGGA